MNDLVMRMRNIIATSLDASAGAWWVPALLGVLVLAAFAALVRKRARPKPALLVLLLSTPLWVGVFALFGARFPADPFSPTALEDTRLPGLALMGLGILALAGTVVCVMFSKPQRLAALAVAAFEGWFVLWVYVVATMTVTGVWL